MRRTLLFAAAVVLPVSGLILATSPAASAGKYAKVTCTNVSGPAGNLTISGCTGGNTGGGAHNVNGAVLAAGGTITWNSGATITVGSPSLVPVKATKCPGYVKSTKKAPYNGPEPSAEKFTLSVTAQSNLGVKVPGAAKGEVCISNAGNVTALKAMKTT